MAVHPELDSITLSTVLSALSYALDLTEGHPRGHAARTCLIGMRFARTLGLSPDEQSDLFYALPLKDAGCSSNAERVAQLFAGTDQEAKRAIWLRDWRKLSERMAYALEYVAPVGSTVGMRLRRLAAMALTGRKETQQLFQVRCDRGAEIARALGFSKVSATAIRSMDEHWDGGGYPDGLRGHQIPLFARIVGLAQVMEIDGATRVRLRRAGLLHDIGKLSVPNRILDKPGRLADREWDAVWLHPYYTYRILERVPVFSELAFDASAHHEKLNGRGYYRNLRSAQLSQTARILAVADIYDALAADRPYRRGLPLEKVLGILGEERGTALCPDCVDALCTAPSAPHAPAPP